MTPLIISPDTKKDIRKLCELAKSRPVQIIGLAEKLATPEGKARHMAQMSQQTIFIPLAFLVTYSIELGQPIGPCRHLSMSVQIEGRVVNPVAAWMIAEEFGFWGGIDKCEVWWEELKGQGQALSVLQPVLHERSN